MYKNIGTTIRTMRKQKKMTLKQVALKSTLSISFISQVELAKSSLTLSSLRKIAEALDVNITSFFEDDKLSLHTKNKGAYNKESFTNTQFSLKNLSGDIQSPILEPMIATLLAGDKSTIPYSHKGEEFIHLLEGVLTVKLDDKEFLMYPGDSLHINSLTPHVWYNDSDKIVRLLMINANLINFEKS